MTVSTENRRNDYDGNGVTATFPFSFTILRPQDLRVVQADQFGAETVLVLDVDYTVSGVGVANGGEIVLTAGPLPTGHHLTLLRNMELLQSTDLRNQGGYSPEVVETALDRVVMTLQQQQEELDRALKVRESSQEHPDSLIASVKESEAAAERSAQTATEKADEAEQSAQQAADSLAAAGLPDPIVPRTVPFAREDATGYDALTLSQMLDLTGPPVGGYVYGSDDPGDPPPPISHFIRCAANLTGAGQYNEGKLSDQSVSGSTPLVNATAIVSDPESPLYGRTIRLLETERRALRPGSVGTLQNDAMQGHWHDTYRVGAVDATTGSGQSRFGADGTNTAYIASDMVRGAISDGANGTPRTANETRPRNIGVSVYRRIK